MWRNLAPLALEAGTLTATTAGALADLCANIVQARALWDAVVAGGFQVTDVLADGRTRIRANPLLSHHRAMLIRVETGRVRFKLAPIGKPVAPPATPEDPFKEFDE